MGPCRLGLGETLDVQVALQEARLAGDVPDVLLLVEHPDPGRTSGRFSQLPVEGAAGCQPVPRGGAVAAHGPGCTSAYLVLDLEDGRRSLRATVGRVQRALLRVLAEYGLRGEQVAGVPGVWVEGRRVATLGMGLRDRATSFGFTLHRSGDPGRLGEALGEPATSLGALLGGEAPDPEDLAGALRQHLGTYLGLRSVEVSPGELLARVGELAPPEWVEGLDAPSGTPVPSSSEDP